MNTTIEKLLLYIEDNVSDTSVRLTLLDNVLEIRKGYIEELERHNNTLEDLIKANKKIRGLEEKVRLSY